MTSNMQNKIIPQMQKMDKKGSDGLNGNNNIQMNNQYFQMQNQVPLIGSSDVYNNQKDNKLKQKRSVGSGKSIKNSGELIMKQNNNTMLNEKMNIKLQNKPSSGKMQQQMMNMNMNMQQNQFPPYQQYQQNPTMQNNQMFQPINPYQMQMQTNKPQKMKGIGMNVMNNMSNKDMPYSSYEPMNNMRNMSNMDMPYSSYQPYQQQVYMNNNNINSNRGKYTNRNEISKNNNYPSGKRVYYSESHFVDFKPYTLKEYKELARTPVIMGSLGANIGTKEWEEKKNKMKKMENYSNKINQTHKGITKLKKDTPQDEIEKDLKRKMEGSCRFKTIEYSKLVRSNRNGHSSNKIGLNRNYSLGNNNDYFTKDLGVINEDDEIKLKQSFNQNIFGSSNIEGNDDFIPLIKNNEIDKELITQQRNNNVATPPVMIGQNAQNENNAQLEQLLQQRELYKAKINDIKESLLN